MGNNLSLGLLVLSLFYSLSLNILFHFKKHIKTEETNIFAALLVTNIISLVFEILCIGTLFFLGSESFISIIINKIFLELQLIFTFIIFSYVYLVVLKEQLNDKKKFYLKRIVSFFFFFSSLLVFLLPITLVFNESGGYSAGLSVNVVYGVVSVAVLLVFILIIKNWDLAMRNRKKMRPFYFFVVGLITTSFIQRLWPALTLSNQVETLFVFLMYNTIENPDLKMIEKLEIAKETADKANLSKTEFLSSMSHEIRTPLNAIVGFSDCILEAKTVTEAKENAKDIISASQTLLEIVNSILDISKIEAGKLEIVNTKYNPKGVFEELATLIKPRMREKGLDFTYEIDSNLPAALYGDKANIKKIVTNFLSNACKYTDRGFVRYEVHSVRLGDYVRLIISVEDSGRGIKKESLDKLFTRFQRLDEDRNTTIEGTGLGLAITKQLTELMGGKVIVHTIYGEGSKFTAVINQRIEVLDAPQKTEVYETLDLHDVKILIVDDAPLNLKVATKLFEKYNANSIDTCSNGFDCVNKIMNGQHYDLIFLDDMMPKMSGIETFQKLTEISGFSTPTIALTANAISGMREKYLGVGFDDYIAKPIEQNELIRVCNMLLGKEDTVNRLTIPVENPQEDVEKNKIIPVEDNIEEVLGDMTNLTKDKNSFTSTYSKTEFIQAMQDNDVEMLEDDEKELATTPEIIDVEPIEILPVEDLDIDETSMKDNEVYDEEYLRRNGADLEKALELLGDMDMYNMTIHDFLDEIDDKWRRINDTLAQEDMNNYSIDVHSLKSDCKYLGFMTLADIAYDHELKSKESDFPYCKEHFPELEKEYYRVIDVIRNYADHNPAKE